VLYLFQLANRHGALSVGVTRHRPEAGRGREREHRLPNLGTREWTTEEACASEAQICMRARVHRLKSLVDPHKSLIASKAVRKRGRNTRTPVHICQGVSVYASVRNTEQKMLRILLGVSDGFILFLSTLVRRYGRR